MSDLESFLGGNAAPEVQETVETQEAVAAPETPPEESGQPRDESGRFAKPAGEEATPPVAEKADQPSDSSKEVEGLIAAKVAESKRRQAAERELSELRQKMEQQTKPDFWSDPDKALDGVRREFSQALAAERLTWSENAARGRYQDFEDKVEHFKSLVEQNPYLAQQMFASPDPADFAYKTAANDLKMREIGDISTFEAKIRAEERAKFDAELKAKIEAEVQKRTNLPGSLSDARAAGGNRTPEWGGPPSMDKILSR